MWAVIFSFFAVPREYQFRVLFWGIFGALLRAIFIVAGVGLISRFDWILYVFGVFLLWTAWKIAHHDETEQVDYERNIAMRLVRRVVPTTSHYDGQKLFTGRTPSGWPPRCSPCSCSSRRPTWCSPSTRCRRSSVSRDLHRLQLERLRHPRPAVVVLPARRHGRQVPAYLNIGLGVILGYVGVKMLLAGPPVEWHPPTCCRCS